jgi:hypothetical protein
VLKASALAGVVPERVAVEARLLRLFRGDVARLRLGYAPENLPAILVMHLHKYTVQTNDHRANSQRRTAGG